MAAAKNAIRDAFTVFDVDGSGSLDAGEVASLLTAFGRDPYAAARSIERFDANNDGLLQFDEFVRLLDDADIDMAASSEASGAAALLSRRCREAGLSAERRMALKHLVAKHWKRGAGTKEKREVPTFAKSEPHAASHEEWRRMLVERILRLHGKSAQPPLELKQRERRDAAAAPLAPCAILIEEGHLHIDRTGAVTIAPNAVPFSELHPRLISRYRGSTGFAQLLGQLTHGPDGAHIGANMAEFERRLCAAAGVAPPEPGSSSAWSQLLFSAFDADHSGTVTTDEVQVGMQALLSRSPSPTRGGANGDGDGDHGDGDGDGDRLPSAPREGAEIETMCRIMFDTYDSDGSGEISLAEFTTQLTRTLRMARSISKITMLESSSSGSDIAEEATPSPDFRSRGSGSGSGSVSGSGSGSGSVAATHHSEEQLQTMAKAMAIKCFSSADLDHGGTIDFAEFRRWFLHHREQARSPSPRRGCMKEYS